MATQGYTGRSDTVWTLLNGLRTPAVHDWLNRFSAFCQKSEYTHPLYPPAHPVQRRPQLTHRGQARCVSPQAGPSTRAHTYSSSSPHAHADAAERQLENAEMLCLIRLGKGLEMMNSLTQTEEAPPPVMAPAPAPAYTPAPAPYGGAAGYDYDEDDDGPVADDV